MSKKLNKPLAAAIGAAFITTLGATTIVNADQNPFAAKQLSDGYMVAEKGAEGKCGEGKCGEGKKEEGKCGEGKCGEGKKGEGKCGESKGEEKE